MMKIMLIVFSLPSDTLVCRLYNQTSGPGHSDLPAFPEVTEERFEDSHECDDGSRIFRVIANVVLVPVMDAKWLAR